ncbi:MAG: DNA repair protein RadC [Bacteroidia bacterium]|nr:DNA repair protein RadC [Bacteroidia bacterium]
MSYYEIKPIKEWRVEDQPREKLEDRGMDALTDSELVAIILRTGSQTENATALARRTLDHFGSLGKFGSATLGELLKIPGIGRAKATAIMSAFELGRRIDRLEIRDLHYTSSNMSARHLRSRIGHLDHEEFYVLYFNNNLQLVGEERISQGGLTSTTVDLRLIFKQAIMRNSPRIVIGHNHPSTNIQPSQQDDLLTRKICQAGQLMDVRVMDHIIVCNNARFYSYADMDRMPRL